MSDIPIRVVNVEFLRPGPSHNQLLSPLTQYLAICDDSNAGVVRVPYEQARYERKLNELRYGGSGGQDLKTVIDEIGEDMAKLLGSVPGLPGALSADQSGGGGLVHLRITLSASELAMLPFELSKVPVNAVQSSAAWLGLQTRPPVTITRSARTVSPEGVDWSRTPRVLFIASNRDDVPFDVHRAALLEAVHAFLHPKRDVHVPAPAAPREEVGRLLTILHDPTVEDIRAECRRDPETPYTHVHILAHGVLEGAQYGLSLRGEEESVDVVDGERLANALTVVGERGVHVPNVVTLASCDSAGVGSLIVPGTHLAHALHLRGVPLVVASQFPLSKTGSEPLARRLYEGLLGGEHPLLVLQQLRAELHARYTSTFHDWASVVVYEALPLQMDERLALFRYQQRRRALDAALERVDRAVDEPGPDGKRVLDAFQSAQRAASRLPLDGPYVVDCIGLTASAGKRMAQAAQAYLKREDAQADALPENPYDILERAKGEYESAVRRVLVEEARPVRSVSTLHWVLVQAISLTVVLGKDRNERMEGAWEAAKFAADLYRDHPEAEQRAWAHASLAELWLLRLAESGLSDEDRRGFGENAVFHTRELVKLYPARDAFPITSTRRQVERYCEWWGSSHFEDGLKQRDVVRPPWNDTAGLLETAREMQRLLRGPRGVRREPPRAAPPPAPPSNGPTAPSPAGGEGATLARRRRGAAADAFLRIEMLPAAHGDSLWIEYGRGEKTHRVLVDCGTEATARHLLERVEQLDAAARSLELFVMTHVDADHIGGALPFFKAIQKGLAIGDVWFNGWEQISGVLGAKQGEMFTTALKDFRLPLNAWQRGRALTTAADRLPRHELPGGLSLTLLSPSPAQLQKMAPVWVRELKRHGLEPGSRVDYGRFLGKTHVTTSTDVDELADAPFSSDSAAANGTSIALLAEYEGAAVLLGADAHAPVLVEAIRRLLAERGGTRLRLDAFKLPHHGSQNNLSRPLLELLDCRRYLVSSNGAHFLHPDRQAIARVVKYGGKKPSLYFNYRTKFNDLWARPQMQEKHRYVAHYPADGQSGLTVSLLGAAH